MRTNGHFFKQIIKYQFPLLLLLLLFHYCYYFIIIIFIIITTTNSRSNLLSLSVLYKFCSWHSVHK